MVLIPRVSAHIEEAIIGLIKHRRKIMLLCKWHFVVVHHSYI